MVNENNVEIADVGANRIRLHEVVNGNLPLGLGPFQLSPSQREKVHKLSNRICSFSFDSSVGDKSEISAKVEHGQIIAVRNPVLSDAQFNLVTGPFKKVDARVLKDQILLSQPERRVVLRYSSDKREQLITLTKLVSTPDNQPWSSDGKQDIVGGQKGKFEEKAMWYKKKQKQAVFSSQRSSVADDDIGELIAKAGKAAVGEENTDSPNPDPANEMISKWQQRESGKEVVKYESGSTVLNMDQNKQTVQQSKSSTSSRNDIRSFKSRCQQLCCWCCSKFTTYHQSTIEPVSDSMMSWSIRERRGSDCIS